MSLAIKNSLVKQGVAHIIFPDDVQTAPAAEEARAGSPTGRLAPVAMTPARESMDAALGLLQKAKRPALIVGHGARFEMDAVIALAEELGCPVLTTFKAKGLIGDCGAPINGGHPLGCGVLGRSGTPIASWFMNECDALLVFGASFSNHTGITPKKPTVQVDYDRMHLGKFHDVDVPVWGEIGTTARALFDGLTGRHAKQPITPKRSPTGGRSGGTRKPAGSRTTAAKASAR